MDKCQNVKASIDKKRVKCQTATMKDSSADPRQKAILSAAWAAFAAYGHRKTSMDDIARGAGMSRPALYLHYRNKQDIFRSLARYYYDEAAAGVEAALAAPDPVPQVLAAAFVAQGGEVMKAMLASLLDTTNITAKDIVQAGEARLQAIYTAWLERAAVQGRVHLVGSARDLAGTITAALKGIKMAGTDYATYRSRILQLAALIGAGLETKPATGTGDESS